MVIQKHIRKKAEGFGKLSPVFLEAADYALNHQWISVDEDLPCNHEDFIETGGHYLKETIYVITVNKYGIIENNYMILYDDGKWEWKYGANPCYWMLIPKLPKEIEIELATK